MDTLPPLVYSQQFLPFDGLPAKKTRLQDAKAQIGLSSQMLARRSGISPSTITNCEQGKVIVLAKATTILNALNAFREEYGVEPLALTDIEWNVQESRFSPEQRAGMSERNRGAGNPMYGKPSAMRGKKGSPESNKKKSEAMKERQISEETRKRMSEAKKGKKQSEQAARNNGLAQRGKTRSPEAKRRYSESKMIYWSTFSEDERREKTMNWTKSGQARSPLMTKDTKPEVTFELYLKEKGWQLGRDYEKQFEIGSCHADFYLVQQNLVVEIYGCWWHQCVQCGYTQGVKTRKGRIRTAEQIHSRDARRIQYIERKGYSVQIVWAHEL